MNGVPPRLGNLPQASALGLHSNESVMVHDSARTAKFLAAGPSIPYTCAHPLPDQVTLQLSDGRHNCEKCLPQGAAGVDVFLVADELDTERPKLLQRE